MRAKSAPCNDFGCPIGMVPGGLELRGQRGCNGCFEGSLAVHPEVRSAADSCPGFECLRKVGVVDGKADDVDPDAVMLRTHGSAFDLQTQRPAKIGGVGKDEQFLIGGCEPVSGQLALPEPPLPDRPAKPFVAALAGEGNAPFALGQGNPDMVKLVIQTSSSV